MTKKATPTRTRQESKPRSVTPDSKVADSVRTSVVLPKTVDANLEVYVLRNGGSKGEIITKLLIAFLEQEGYQPDKIPKVQIAY